MAKLDFYDKLERPWPNNRLERATIVGHTTPNSSRVWVRTKNEGRHHLIVSTAPIRVGSAAPTVEQVDGEWLLRNSLAANPQLQSLHACHTSCSTFASDNTSVHDVVDLAPDTRYHYAVIREIVQDGAPANQWELGIESPKSFRTLPETAASFSFGLFSCHMPYADDRSSDSVDAAMWQIFSDELDYADARLVIGGGDQVYADGNDGMSIWKWLKRVRGKSPTNKDMVSWYRDIYRGYWGFPSLQKVFASYPTYMIWDDHEIMDGWGSYTKKELSQQLDTLLRIEDVDANVALANRMKKAATKVYVEYQHSHNPAADKDVFDYPFEACGCDFYTLDMRHNKSVKDGSEDGSGQILGAAQHERLAAWAEEVKNAGKRGPIFVVSTVPTVHLKDFVLNLADWAAVFGGRDDVRDHWEHDINRDEYKKLMSLLFECSHQSGRPLVILSGDVHVGAIFSLHHAKFAKARVFQVTSSGITYNMLSALKRKALGKAVKQTGMIVGKDEDGNPEPTGIGYHNHHTYVQNNFAILKVQMEGNGTSNIYVHIIGRDKDLGLTEYHRLELLAMN